VTMIVRTKHFGYDAFSIQDGKGHIIGDVRFTDNETPVTVPRKCPRCNQYPTSDDHDPCIANLPGVEFACCGHGTDEGYIKFENGIVIRGNFTEIYQGTKTHGN
jgi:hypothetical protein